MFPLMPTTEAHRRIVGAGQGASFTHPIRVGGLAVGTGGISIGASVGYRRDQRAIAVDVDVG